MNVIEDRDVLWDCVAQEALMRDPATVGEPQHKLLKSQVESKLKVVDVLCWVGWQHFFLWFIYTVIFASPKSPPVHLG